MIKRGEKWYEWVLLHIRNGEQFAGLVEVPKYLTDDAEFYKRDLATYLIKPSTYVDGGQDDRIIELCSPHGVSVQSAGAGKLMISCVPMNLGDLVFFLRAAEVLYVQFLDDKSPIVIEIRKGMANIVTPGSEGEARTGSGIILPGAGA